MLASYLIDPERHSHSLADVARFELETTLSDGEKLLLEHRLLPGRLSEQAIETTAANAAQVARTALRAHAVLEPRLHAAGCAPLLHELELPLSYVLCDMEMTGVRVDVAHLARMSKAVDVQLVEMEQRCRTLAGQRFQRRLAAAAREQSCSTSSVYP